LDELSHRIIGIAINVHKKLGPGFQEKIYEEALLRKFENDGIGFGRHVLTITGLVWEISVLTFAVSAKNLRI